ncbi:Gfo/Idh/MocA family oxidoreductase [Candidatus Poribacteria bacterium]|nr:Gfo/Idh/MocA family oxidoreductase [Candidatus Poribacteria bacterium]MBT5711917.1 Gfo/Idh/MocA family oxidoreductase [Candidatus Poribacteria bacterium]MBT7806949.1 Gfo/Idh/MocA family oxidoreductase [Candidatus Poribacteria bacterium]
MYRVGVIGLGAIAARYSNPEDAHPYCHVGGIRHSDTTRLVAVADMSQERRDEFAQTWGPAFPDGSINYYETDTQMLESEDLDIVAVCVRGPHHFAVMQDVLKADLRAIFLEKPAGCSLAETDEMARIANDRDIHIVVDYTRHWSPALLRLQDMVKDGLVGEVQSVIGYCGGGVLSFSIHNTDMICQFAGYDPTAVSASIRGGGDAPDGYEPEPAPLASTIEFASGVQGFHVGNHGKAPAFAVDVLGSEGQLRAGFYLQPTLRNADGAVVDNATLDLPGNVGPFKIAYEQITGHLDGGPPPHCAGSDWVAVNEIGFATIESGMTGARVDLPCANRDRMIFANG